jgi:hypothetical protein
MKNLRLILLVAVYLISAVGVNLFVHYCGGKVSSVSIAISHNDACGCDNKKMKKDCCKDETILFQIDDDQIQQNQHLSPPIKYTCFYALINKPLDIANCLTINQKVFYCLYHPPNDVGSDLYLFNRVFRI